jgi:diguanylate cyclase (GGDEF)-like protein
MNAVPNGRHADQHQDPVTGTANEGALLRFLDAVLAMAEPVGPQIGMLCLHVDGLNRLAVQHGPAVRDAVLLGIADRIHERVRTQDLVGRVDRGFGICLADIFPAQAVSAGERLLWAVRGEPVPTPVGALPLTCSLGLVLGRGGAEDGRAMLARARALRDAARRAGGNMLVADL